eukprot:TRINITY_DN1388_c0_g1_i3.p4 TRINITY_DN1388_c0_g1~~TRINITY_DN1388_c0_g1_i3.p4  ORF type:complete len:166 (-),score=4.51 TRINITY_DN1388_c0_g1_i3:274-771(-)
MPIMLGTSMSKDAKDVQDSSSSAVLGAAASWVGRGRTIGGWAEVRLRDEATTDALAGVTRGRLGAAASWVGRGRTIGGWAEVRLRDEATTDALAGVTRGRLGAAASWVGRGRTIGGWAEVRLRDEATTDALHRRWARVAFCGASVAGSDARLGLRAALSVCGHRD